MWPFVIRLNTVICMQLGTFQGCLARQCELLLAAQRFQHHVMDSAGEKRVLHLRPCRYLRKVYVLVTAGLLEGLANKATASQRVMQDLGVVFADSAIPSLDTDGGEIGSGGDFYAEDDGIMDAPLAVDSNSNENCEAESHFGVGELEGHDDNDTNSHADGE